MTSDTNPNELTFPPIPHATGSTILTTDGLQDVVKVEFVAATATGSRVVMTLRREHDAWWMPD